MFFFFKQKTAYEMRISDWSSDVGSSDLNCLAPYRTAPAGRRNGPMKTPAMIKISQLHKSYGENAVLKGIDLEVDLSQVVVVIGPSGSGKSTLLRCCNGLEVAQQGTIDIRSEEHTSELQSLMRISYAVFCLKKE